MSIENLKNQLPEFAKDIRLNLSSVMTSEGAPDLSQKQIHAIALACAFAAKNDFVIAAMLKTSAANLSADEMNGVKSAATIMAMNNIYYRFVHLASDNAYSSLPVKLRMNVIGNPGMDKTDFELCCLAISAINGCGMCLDAHANALHKAGVSKLAIQSAIRIASVLNATATAITFVAQ